MYSEEYNILYRLSRAAKAGQKSIVPAQRVRRTNHEGPLSFVFESPFTSVSTMDEGSKRIRHGGGGADLRCPVYTTVHFSLRNEGSSEYIRV
jgi:hypothetical protein